MEALTSLIEETFGSFTTATLSDALEEAGIANARLNSVEQFLQHPQLIDRGRVVEVETPCGTVESFLPPMVAAGLRPRMDPVPALGQHNEAILRELGLSDKDNTPS